MRQAIVLGGSLAGLVTAQVLSKHYARVTVVEQDVLPEVMEQRRGVPQGKHAHGLLAGGGRALEELFPGLSDEVRRDGAVPADVARDLRWFHEGACLARFRSGLDGFLLSRPLVERAVRARVKALPNVSFLEGERADGLIASANRGRVLGVKVDGEEMGADLVVDATGRGSQSPQWLEMLGYRRPLEERVEVALAYTTRLFRRRPEHLNGDGAAVIPSTPEGKVGGVMLRQEDERWIVTLIGHFGHHAPEDLAGFIEYARHLPAPYIYEVVRSAEPIGEACSARFPASVRRRYERLDRFPEGYLVMGDAICSFNPKYGQGMTVTALEGKVLDACLAEGVDRLAQRFHRRAAEVVDIPWAIAVGNDLRMPETVGPRTLGGRFINWYMAHLHKAGHEDAVVSMAFHQVANLLARPESLLAPRIAWRVAKQRLFGRPAVVFNGQSRFGGSIPQSEKS